MSQIICSTSFYSVGCTFMDWSINYIHGKSRMLNKNLGWIDIVNNPLEKTNAHGHKKNHPSGWDNTINCVEFLQQNSDFATLYPFPMTIGDAACKLQKDINNLSNADNTEIFNLIYQDYHNMIKWLGCHTKTVFVAADKSWPLFHTVENRAMEKLLHINKTPQSVQELRNSKDLIFFRDSTQQWSQLNLNDIWDLRERLALDTRPFDLYPENVDFSFDHFWIESKDWYFNGHKKIKQIMNWLDLTVCQDRYEHWLPVYRQWQDVQLQALEFQFNYQHIVDCVLHGWSFPIDLTFDQEVVIQHCLIYQHNLNLKTWQLTKFPNNTQDLHKLLEHNTHPLTH